MDKIKDIEKLLFVGDLHLNSSTPQSRIDEYGETCLNKLNQIRSLCKMKDCEVVVFSGDIFHKTQQPLSYVNKVVEAFQKFEEDGITVYIIVGNHDIAYNKMKYINNSPLGNLLLSNKVKMLDELEITTKEGYKIDVRGFNYPENIKPYTGDNISICVAHRYYDYLYDDWSLGKKDIEDLGYKIYALGHDHINYTPIKVSNSYILRPGSVLRGTSHNYNLERDVFVQFIKFNGTKDNPKVSFARAKLRTADAENVFTESAFNKDNEEDSSMASLSKDIDELLKKMDEEEEKNPVYRVIDNMDLDEEVKNRVELYLENYGIYR